MLMSVRYTVEVVSSLNPSRAPKIRQRGNCQDDCNNNLRFFRVSINKH